MSSPTGNSPPSFSHLDQVSKTISSASVSISPLFSLRLRLWTTILATMRATLGSCCIFRSYCVLSKYRYCMTNSAGCQPLFTLETCSIIEISDWGANRIFLTAHYLCIQFCVCQNQYLKTYLVTHFGFDFGISLLLKPFSLL